MGINQLFRTRVAEAAVGRYRIVKAGATVGGCVIATAATDKLLGTSDELAHISGETVDMAVAPVPFVVLGGTVAAGDALTSDAAGAAVATTTPGHRFIGFAEKAGVLGDEITYLRSLGVV